MEDIGLRIPLIFEQFNELLDNKTLVNCMEVSPTFCAVIEDQRSGRFLIARTIQSYLKNSNEFENDWMTVVKKLPIQKLKEFVILVKEFYHSVPIRSEQKWSPMHVTAERGCLDLCKLIAKVTPLKNPQSQNNFTPIHFAAQAGHLEVYEFLTEDVEDKNPKADRGLSTLHLVAKSDHLPIYQLICENALDINPIMEGGITPLHLAAQFGNFNVCKYICDNVGNVSPLRSYDLASPLTLAFHRGQIRIAKLLIENDMDNIWNILETVFCTFAMWLVLFLCVTLKVNWWFGDYETCIQGILCRNMFLHYDYQGTILYTMLIFFSSATLVFATFVISVWMMFALIDKWFSYYHSPIIDH
jgi:hypothetical protein